MNFKTCKVLNEHFLLDEEFVPYVKGKNNQKVYVTDSLEKGYIYASLFFYDEVTKEIAKLEKMIRKMYDEVMMDAVNPDPAILMLDLSRRAKDIIGNDSLDALIKKILSEHGKHMALLPDKKETDKYEKICESILTELLTSFYDATIRNATQEGNVRTFSLSQKYIAALTERQKKLINPALRMVGFLNDLRLDEFKAKDYAMSFRPVKLGNPFSAQEEKIKLGLKKLMAANV